MKWRLKFFLSSLDFALWISDSKKLDLMTVFKTSDLQKFGQKASNVVSLAFKTNKKNGSKIAAMLDISQATVSNVLRKK